MAKSSQEIEKEFIEGLRAATGKDLTGWLTTIKSSGIEKRNDIIKWLKEQHNFRHMDAGLLVGIYANGGKPVYASEQSLLDNQFEKFPDMRPLFDKLKSAILKWDSAVDFVTKKTYVSIAKKREFGAINIRRGELRLGMDLGELPFDDHVEKAKLTGPMPRISHMVSLKSEKDIDERLFNLLKISDERVNS